MIKRYTNSRYFTLPAASLQRRNVYSAILLQSTTAQHDVVFVLLKCNMHMHILSLESFLIEALCKVRYCLFNTSTALQLMLQFDCEC